MLPSVVLGSYLGAPTPLHGCCYLEVWGTRFVLRLLTYTNLVTTSPRKGLLAAGYATTADAQAGTEDCELAIIGGGPSGVYTAWRLSVDTNTLAAKDICVFERVRSHGKGHDKGDLMCIPNPDRRERVMQLYPPPQAPITYTPSL